MKKIDYRNAFFDELVKIGIKDKNVIFLSVDTDAESLKIFKKKFPERFVNTGVAEQETINLAAGLALSGKKVFIYSLLPFIRLLIQQFFQMFWHRFPFTVLNNHTSFLITDE